VKKEEEAKGVRAMSLREHNEGGRPVDAARVADVARVEPTLADVEEWATNYLKQPDNLYPLQIDFTPNREIILNGYFLLGKPDFDSENELVFGYLFKNPNTRTSQEDIEKALNIKINKSFHKIIENLGFKGDLKHIFFQVSKNTILFRNPVTPEELNKLGYSRIKLS
jgi:hypothetical protein